MRKLGVIFLLLTGFQAQAQQVNCILAKITYNPTKITKVLSGKMDASKILFVETNGQAFITSIEEFKSRLDQASVAFEAHATSNNAVVIMPIMPVRKYASYGKDWVSIADFERNLTLFCEKQN